MNKILMLLFTVLFFNSFASDAMAGGAEKKEREVVLTARFIEIDDLDDSSANVGAIKEATKTLTWDKAKKIMLALIGDKVIRRVLFFDKDRLIGTCGAGRMPIAVRPVKKKDAGSFEFAEGQESIASAYVALAGSGTTEAYEDSTSTWSLTRSSAPILAATLMPNTEKDPMIISLMHQAAYDLFRGHRLSGFDVPTLYVSMVSPIKELLGIGFGKFLSVEEGQFDSGEKTIVHNYYPGKDDGRHFILAGRY